LIVATVTVDVVGCISGNIEIIAKIRVAVIRFFAIVREIIPFRRRNKCRIVFLAARNNLS